jgi:multiple sugar transport system substrate-binding protein
MSLRNIGTAGNAGLTRRTALQMALGVLGNGGGLLLAACQPAKPQQEGTPPGGVKSATVQFFARGDDAIFKVFRDLREAFTAQYPQIKVEIDEVPGDFYQKLQLQLSAGTPPDTMFECDCTLGTSVRNKITEPLDDYMKRDRRFKKDDYWDIAWYASTYGGKVYGLPYDGGSVAIFYNKDLFKAAGVPDLDAKNPLTFDEFLQLARRLTLDESGRRPGESGFDRRRIVQFGIDPARGLFQAYIFAAGGEVIGSDGSVPIDEPAAADGLQWLADLGARHYVAPTPEVVQTAPISFATGNVAMQYAGVWNMVRYRQNKFAWDVAPFPKYKVKTSLGWYSPLSILASSKVKDAAWEWIFFCCSEPGQRIVSSLGQAVPTVKSLARTEVFLNPNVPPAHKEVFLDEMDPKILRTPGDRFGSYFGGYVREFRQIFNPIFDPVWLGQKTALQAAKEARPKLERLLKTGEVT